MTLYNAKTKICVSISCGIAVATILATPAAGASTAFTSDVAGTTGPQSASMPRFELVPAIDNDLPAGKASFSLTFKESKPRPFAAPWVCTVYASDPTAAQSPANLPAIYGDSSNFCSGTGYQPIHLDQYIQQYRGLGQWLNKATGHTGYANVDFQSYTGYWTCAKGTGNQLYRVITTGYAEGVNFEKSVQSENDLRVTCP